MNYEDVKVGMHVYLKDGYQENFIGCIGRVIAKRKTISPKGSNILMDFSLNGNKPPFIGHKDWISLGSHHEYDLLPEALERPAYESRWWVHYDYITEPYNNVVLDGGLL